MEFFFQVLCAYLFYCTCSGININIFIGIRFFFFINVIYIDWKNQLNLDSIYLQVCFKKYFRKQFLLFWNVLAELRQIVGKKIDKYLKITTLIFNFFFVELIFCIPKHSNRSI